MLHGLRFDQGERLLLELPHRLADEIRSQALAAMLRGDFQFDLPKRPHAPGGRERLDVPEHHMGQRLARLAPQQAKQRPLAGLHRASLPPGAGRRILHALQLRAAANLHLLPVDRGPKAGQLAVQNQRPVDLAIIGLAESREHRRIGLQNAGQFAAAEKSPIKWRQRANAAAVDHFRTPPPQILLGQIQQPGRDGRLLGMSHDQQHRNHPKLGR